jgi:hypothetical protein
MAYMDKLKMKKKKTPCTLFSRNCSCKHAPTYHNGA